MSIFELCQFYQIILALNIIQLYNNNDFLIIMMFNVIRFKLLHLNFDLFLIIMTYFVIILFDHF